MEQQNTKIWRWLPLATSIFMMALIIGVSVKMAFELTSVTDFRKHTFTSILSAQTFEDRLVDAQRSEHAFVANGAANLLVEYRNDTNAEIQELNELKSRTLKDPEQQKRLTALSTAMQVVFANDDKVIGIYGRQGSAAAAQEDDADKNAVDEAIEDLEKFTDGETRLLAENDAREQRDYHRAAWLLIWASVVVAVLLGVAHYLACLEAVRRRQSEAKQIELIKQLQAALAEVKTLSGFIPICSWCKKIRNDKGFWSSVEHYVHTHTDAKFSHGICPECEAKLEAEEDGHATKQI